MLRIAVTILIVCSIWHGTADSIVAYRNAQFIPLDPRHILANLSSSISASDCLCQCYAQSLCFVCNHFAVDKICLLYTAQLNQGQLMAVPVNCNATMYSVGNRSMRALEFFQRTNETVYAIWNTTAGADSMRATPGVSVGTYWSSEPAENVFDGRKNTVYTNHGACNVSWLSIECGENTGLYLKLNNEPRALVAFYLCTNSYGFARDPLQITIEGSQAPENVLDSGSQWTLIYNGSSGLLSNPGRAGQGALMRLANISVAYSSFRLLTVSKKGNESSVSFSEWSLLMY